MRCPRCRTENDAASVRCAGCGAPVALPEDPPAIALDAPIDLDRRGARRRSGAAPSGEVGWEMEPPAAPIPRRARAGPTNLRLAALAPLQPAPRTVRPLPGVLPPSNGSASTGVGSPPIAGPGPPSPPPASPVVKAIPDRLPIGRVEAPTPRPRAAPAAAARVPPAPAAPAPPVRVPPPRPTPAPVAARERPAPAAPLPAEEPELDLEAHVDAIEVHLRRAPSWRRAASWAVDLGLLGLFVSLLLGPILGRSDLPLEGGIAGVVDALTRSRGVLLPAVAVALVAAFAYQWLGLALMGATPGSRLLGLRVAGPDGRRPSPGRSALRAALSLPSFLLLGLGVLLGLFTRSGRALHDFGAGTWVVQAP